MSIFSFFRKFTRSGASGPSAPSPHMPAKSMLLNDDPSILTTASPPKPDLINTHIKSGPFDTPPRPDLLNDRPQASATSSSSDARAVHDHGATQTPPQSHLVNDGGATSSAATAPPTPHLVNEGATSSFSSAVPPQPSMLNDGGLSSGLGSFHTSHAAASSASFFTPATSAVVGGAGAVGVAGAAAASGGGGAAASATVGGAVVGTAGSEVATAGALGATNLAGGGVASSGVSSVLNTVGGQGLQATSSNSVLSASQGGAQSTTSPGSGTSTTQSAVEQSTTSPGSGTSTTQSAAEQSTTSPGSGTSATQSAAEQSTTSPGSGTSATQSAAEQSTTSSGSGTSATQSAAEQSTTSSGSSAPSTTPSSAKPVSQVHQFSARRESDDDERFVEINERVRKYVEIENARKEPTFDSYYGNFVDRSDEPNLDCLYAVVKPDGSIETITDTLIFRTQAFRGYYRNYSRSEQIVVPLPEALEEMIWRSRFGPIHLNLTPEQYLPFITQRSDPLGLYQEQNRLPMQYGSEFLNQPDELGLKTACRQVGSGRCASCMCRTPDLKEQDEKEQDEIFNLRYGTDSFIVSCVQGEVWNKFQETGSSSESGGLGIDWKATFLQNTFMGSFAYERTNFFTQTTSMFHQEIVGIPIGVKTLRVGIGSSKGAGIFKLKDLASYFEDGSGKFVNFFMQKNHAGGVYQVSAPSVEFQGTTQNGLVSLSTSNVDEPSYLSFGALMFFLPPFHRIKQTYIQTRRRAEIQLAGSTIAMRAGDLTEEDYVTTLKQEQKLKEKAPFITATQFVPKAIQELESWYPHHEVGRPGTSKSTFKVKRSLGLIQYPSFILLGGQRGSEDLDARMVLSVPKTNSTLGGSHVALYPGQLLMGGATEGPDLVIDHEDQKIKFRVGPNRKGMLQALDLTEDEIKIRAVIDPGLISINQGDRPRKVLHYDFPASKTYAEICINSQGIKITYSEGSAKTTTVELLKTGLSVVSEVPIKLRAKKNININADGDLEINGSKVTVNGAAIAAT